MISRETSRYANKCFSNPNYRKEIYNGKCRDTTTDKIKAYFALLILMSQVRKPKVKRHWSSRAIETPNYGKTMSFSTFSNIKVPSFISVMMGLWICHIFLLFTFIISNCSEKWMLSFFIGFICFFTPLLFPHSSLHPQWQWYIACRTKGRGEMDLVVFFLPSGMGCKNEGIGK